MHPYSRIAALALCIAPLAMRADSLNVDGPVWAVVFDTRTQSIRQVTGVPGGSVLGATLAGPLDMADVALDGDKAVALQAGQWYTISGLSGGNPVWTQLSSAPPSVDRVAWNRDSSAAAVYSAVASTLTVIGTLSGGGASQTPLRVDGLAGEVTALALESSGGAAVVAITGDQGGLYLVTTQSPPALVAPLNHPATVFLIQDQDLLAVDADALQVFEIRDYHGAAQWLPFASLPQSASKPSGLEMSPDGQWLFAADQACQCVAVYQFSTLLAEEPIALDIIPGFLKPVSRGRQFQLNAPTDAGAPFWILTTGGDAASVYFVSGGVQ